MKFISSGCQNYCQLYTNLNKKIWFLNLEGNCRYKSRNNSWALLQKFYGWPVATDLNRWSEIEWARLEGRELTGRNSRPAWRLPWLSASEENGLRTKSKRTEGTGGSSRDEDDLTLGLSTAGNETGRRVARWRIGVLLQQFDDKTRATRGQMRKEERRGRLYHSDAELGDGLRATERRWMVPTSSTAPD